MLPEHAKHIKTFEVSASDSLRYTIDEKVVEYEIKCKIYESLYREMLDQVSFTQLVDPLYMDKKFRGSVVIMSVDEYKKILDSRYVVHNPSPVQKVNYPSSEDVDPAAVVKKAEEVIEKAVKTSRTATDYLTNRLSQIHNEHLLPKRKS